MKSYSGEPVGAGRAKQLTKLAIVDDDENDRSLMKQARCNDPEPPEAKPCKAPIMITGIAPTDPRAAAMGIGAVAAGALVITAPEALPILAPVLIK